MLGGLFVLAIFAIILRWGLNVSRRCPDRFGQLLAGGHDAHDLLLRRDQPDDGHGPGASRRNPPAIHEPRRLVDDDKHDLHRHDHGRRSLARRLARNHVSERTLVNLTLSSNLPLFSAETPAIGTPRPRIAGRRP